MTNKNKFKLVANGYDVQEVNDFLRKVTEEFEKVVNKNVLLSNENMELRTDKKDLEDKTSVESIISELDTFAKLKHNEVESLEKRKKELEKKIDIYEQMINEMVNNHLTVINKLR